MKTFLQCCVTGFLGLLVTQAYTQNPEGVPPVDAQVPSEQGSQLTNQDSGIYPDDESPWFSAEGLQDELELDEDQIKRLNDAYGSTWKQMRATQADSGSALDAESRSQRTREYRDRFDSKFSRSSSNVFRTPDQQRRFNQLQMQYQGYGAFDNPRLQRQFNLNDTQKRQLQELRNEWDGQLGELRESYARNPEDARSRFNDLRGSSRQRFEGILNDQQRQSYNEMTGQEFDFGADTFLRGRDTNSGGNREASPGFNTGQAPGFNTGLNPNPANNNNTGNNSEGAGTGGVEAGAGTNDSGAGTGVGAGTGSGSGS